MSERHLPYSVRKHPPGSPERAAAVKALSPWERARLFGTDEQDEQAADQEAANEGRL